MIPQTRVLKFGGTSVQNFAAMQDVARITQQQLSPRTIVVASATAGTTDLLVQIIEAIRTQDRQLLVNSLRKIDSRHAAIRTAVQYTGTISEQADAQYTELLSELTRTTHQLFSNRQLTGNDEAEILSYGELISSTLLTEIMQSRGINARYFDARDIVATTSSPLSAQPLPDGVAAAAAEKLLPVLNDGYVCVTQGFIGRDEQGNTTTLGRGGSDFSAAILGVALDADQIEIWTDVNGVMTADPRMVPDARHIEHLSFREAAELAYFGAKVLHPSTLLPAMEKNIPVIVKNTRRPEFPGTTILPKNPKSSPVGVRSIACKHGITVLNITSTRMLMAHGFLSKVFDVFNTFETPIDLVSTSEVSVSMTIDDDSRLEEICQALSQFGETETITKQSIVCLVGRGISVLSGIAARAFNAVSGINVKMISYCAGKDNLSFIIDEAEVPEAVRQLHQTFFGDEAPQTYSAEELACVSD